MRNRFRLRVGLVSHGVCFALVATRPGVVSYRIGWGYDADLPLRFKRAFHSYAATLPRSKRTRVDECWSFAGFYFGRTTVDE